MSRRFWLGVVVAVVVLAACATGGGNGTPGTPDATPSDAGRLADGGDQPDAAPPVPDAAPPDAPIPPSAVISLAPGSLAVARGGTATLTLTIDQPALAGGQVVTLDSDDPGGAVFTIPASATVDEGETDVDVIVTSVAIGGPLDVRAELGASVQAASVRVVPALISVAPVTSMNVVAGTSASFVVTLEAAPADPVDVALSVAPAGVVSTAAAVTVPGGAASATFPVMGLALGRAQVRAAIGDQQVTTFARGTGLYFSEILYDVTGTDTMREWVELHNAAPVAIDLTGVVVRVANSAGGYVDALALSGVASSGACVTVGGPSAGLAADNFTPDGFVYLVAGDFSPDLGNAGSAAGDAGDGLSLVTAAGDVVDNVIYGRNNVDLVTDEDGVAPAAVDVGDAPAAQSIERTSPGLSGAWVIQLAPNPGDCTAVSM